VWFQSLEYSISVIPISLASCINWKATASGVSIKTFHPVFNTMFCAMDNDILVFHNPVSANIPILPFFTAFSIMCFWKSNISCGYHTGSNQKFPVVCFLLSINSW
jgi:hypothetical protein